MKHLLLISTLALCASCSTLAEPVSEHQLPPGFVDPTPADPPDKGDVLIWQAEQTGSAVGDVVPAPVGFAIDEIVAALAAVGAASWASYKGYKKITKNTSQDSSEEVKTP